MSLARLERAGKLYGPAPDADTADWAARGIDLEIGREEVVGLLGPNRAGKSTVAKLLLSLCRPTEGRVERFDRPGEDLRTLARVGFVPEDPSFPPDRTATELLRYLGTLSLIPRGRLRKRVGDVLQRLDLADRAKEPVGRFSKGMLRRLAIAQALLHAPDLLILDEPAEGLDLPGRELLRGVIDEVRGRGGSVLLISHAVQEVVQVCDRILVLVRGRAAFSGRVDNLALGGDVNAVSSLEGWLLSLYGGPRG
ncbi:MAG: ABC transporter ATP-binding protein [Isosphaeraceae bacterium]